MPDQSSLVVPQELLILGAAVKTGLVEKLKERSMDVEELAREMKADARSVWVVAEALCELGYLAKEEGKLRLSDAAMNLMFHPDSPDYIGFSFMHRYNILQAWAHLPEVIFSGRPHPRERTPEDLQYFMAAMSHGSGKSAPSIAAFCLEGQGKEFKVLDIGGGPLTYARAFASTGARVTILDLPEVVNVMAPLIGRDETIEMVPGDFNVSLPPGPYDLAFLGNICHIFGEGENRELFKKTASVLKENGRIAIVDFIRGTGPMAAIFGVNMLVNTRNGGTWTYTQYNNWLEEAGFEKAALHEVGGRQLLLARKLYDFK